MISEGSCDTEDWGNDAGNSALHHRNKYILKYIQKENNYLKLKIFNNITFTVFWSNATLQGSYRVWNLIKYWKSMEKRKQSMENYLCFQTFGPILFKKKIIEHSEFIENKCIVQEERFHGSCLVIL